MNPDDETLLSAYLDDELDPADRLAVEWSIESNPPLAEQYRSLVEARDAVAGLPRPSIPCDLGATLGARLAANRRRDRIRKLARPAAAALAFSSFFGIAASLIFALILLNHSLHESDQTAQIVAVPPQAPGTHQSKAIVELTDRVEVATTSPSASSNPQNTPTTHASPVLVNHTRDLDARRKIVGMLEQPHVRRIRIVTDVMDASDKVKKLIDLDARKNPEFGRISVCQEIVIDPDYPEAVEVFAVPMDERDRRAFVGQLAQAFPDLVEEESETSPDLVTQLTEVGQVALFSGAKAAPLGDPPHDLSPFIANRAEIPKIHYADTNPQPLDTTGTKNPGESKVAVVTNRPKAPSADLKPGERVTVLVWVVTRPNPRL